MFSINVKLRDKKLKMKLRDSSASIVLAEGPVFLT